MRRAFHTLKGSGRMVGAELIGEYCWSVEQLLNRVIDGTVPRSPPLVNYLRRAMPAVAELLEQLEVGATPASDIRALMAEAVELGRPVAPVEADAAADSADATEVLPAIELDGVLASAPPAQPAPPVELASSDETLVAHLPPRIPGQAVPTVVLGPDDATLVVRLPPAAGGPAVLGPDDATLMAPSLPPRPPAMDPVLLDILSREVAVHLGAIRDFVAKAGEAVSQPLPESIFRACHTLHGSLTMAGVTSAVEVAAPLNELMGVLHTARLPADAAIIAATGETAAVVARIVEQLRAPEPPSPVDAAEVQATVAALTARLHDLVAQAGERAAALSAESVDGGTASMPIPVLTEQDFAAASDEVGGSIALVGVPRGGQLEVEPPEPGMDLTEVFDVGEMDLGDAGLELEPAAEPEPEPELRAGAGTEPEPEPEPETEPEPEVAAVRGTARGLGCGSRRDLCRGGQRDPRELRPRRGAPRRPPGRGAGAGRAATRAAHAEGRRAHGRPVRHGRPEPRPGDAPAAHG